MITMSEEEYRQDKKIRKIDEDSLKFTGRMKQIEAELSGIEQRLDAEVERQRAVAISKKESYEQFRRQAQAAEQDWKAADKLFQKAKKDKQQTIRNLEKEHKTLRKRIEDAKKARTKRISEIEKTKQKEIEKAKQAKAKEMEQLKQQEVQKTEEEKKRELGMS